MNILSTLLITMSMNIQMPVLPYSADALAPAISKATVDLHYGKHLQAYVNNLNTLIEGTTFAGKNIESIVMDAPEGAIFNNAGQILNHDLYFTQFKPYPPKRLEEKETLSSYEIVMKYNPPTPTVISLIEKDFGTFKDFIQAMEEASVKLFGSGWAWLVAEKDGKLKIVQYANAGTPARYNLTPILGFDVWEHAYYLDTQNRRAEHIAQLWNIIDWQVIEKRMTTTP